MKGLVSVIMPTYNMGSFIGEAIQSVLLQSYPNWELIIIDDGSTDDTEKVIKSFEDKRIQYYYQLNKGVSAARNFGLAIMKGVFFCFLDADDKLPPKSLQCRTEIFEENSNVEFVDGVVERRNESLKKLISLYTPKLKNKNPLKDLASLNGHCFFGPSWMIKKALNVEYKFKEGLSHAEDLLFYMEIARNGGKYTYTFETVYIYRDTSSSAMKNLDGLENGYRQVFEYIKEWPELTFRTLLANQLRVKKIMFLSYLSAGEPVKAFRALI